MRYFIDYIFIGGGVMNIGDKLPDGFSLIALKKLNAMIKRDDFVAIASVGDVVTIQYKNSIQQIDRFGRVYND